MYREFHIGTTAYGALPVILDPSDGITPIEPTSVTYQVYRDGVLSVEGITIIVGGTGERMWSYNPAGDVAGEHFTIFFTISAGGETTKHMEELRCIEPERGTNGANTTVPDNAAVQAAQTAAESADGKLDDVLTAVETDIPALINALNQSASRRAVLVTSVAYEIPDSGSTSFVIELRTFDGDGAPVAASGTTLTSTGSISGDLSGSLSVVSNPETGVYRWTFSVAASATVEQVVFRATATLSDGTFAAVFFGSVTDSVAVDFTSADRTALNAIFNKLPSSSHLTGTSNADGSGYATPANITDSQDAITNALATVSDVTDKLDTTLEDDGSGGYQFTALALENVASGTFSGPHTLTVTIEDGAGNPVTGATVLVSNGVLKEVKSTVATNIAEFTLPAGAYKVSVSKPGRLSVSNQDVTVSADVDVTYDLLSQTVTLPDDPEESTGFIVTLNKDGSGPKAGVSVNARLIVGPGTVGISPQEDAWTVLSDVNGLVQFVGMLQGAQYKVWRGVDCTKAVTVTVPAAPSFQLPEILGRDRD